MSVGVLVSFSFVALYYACRIGSKVLTHRQFSLQAVAVATVNATFDWVASESKRVLREVLQVREKERRLEVTPPVACARPIEAAARDDGDKATDPYDDIGDDVDLGAGDAE